MTRAMCAVSLAALMCSVPSNLAAAAGRAQAPQAASQQSSAPPAAPAPASPGRPGGGPAVSRADVAEVQDMLDGLELTQADKRLQVTDAQYGPFIQRLHRLQALRKQHGNQRQKLMAQLRQLANQNPPAEEALIDAQTKKLDDFERQAAQEMQAALAAIDEVLNIRQRAKFRVFEENLEQQRLDFILRVVKPPIKEQGRGGK